MCLALPALVTELLPDAMARVSLDGVAKIISVALLDEVRVGDYVVLHVGYALARIDADEAARTLALLEEAAEGQRVRPRLPPNEGSAFARASDPNSSVGSEQRQS